MSLIKRLSWNVVEVLSSYSNMIGSFCNETHQNCASCYYKFRGNNLNLDWPSIKTAIIIDASRGHQLHEAPQGLGGGLSIH
jgi:hypothetical protein